MTMRMKDWLFAGAATACLAWLGAIGPPCAWAAQDPAPDLARPVWKVGDTWVIETVTDQIQVREAMPSEKSPPIRWLFKVSGLADIGGHKCYQIDITCEAKGRVRPSSMLFIDTQTMMLREMRTQMAGFGQFHTVRESYEPQGGQVSPVLTFGNVLPIDLPAFLPKQSKAVSFNYVSQTIPAGAKDPDLIRFGHSVTQQVVRPSGKSLNRIPSRYAKALDRLPVVEVRLANQDKSVVQLWQQGNPWPVYTHNGRTEAKLVSVGEGE